jgi:hypothetical protein
MIDQHKFEVDYFSSLLQNSRFGLVECKIGFDSNKLSREKAKSKLRTITTEWKPEPVAAYFYVSEELVLGHSRYLFPVICSC